VVVVLVDRLVHLETGNVIEVAGNRIQNGLVVHHLVRASELVTVFVHQMPDDVLRDDLLSGNFRRRSHSELPQDLDSQLFFGEVQEQVASGARDASV